MSVKPRKPRARLKDLARLVSVSPATISNAYHHPERLSATLRAKILEHADRLGYHPDPTARGLRMQTTGTLGVVYADALSWAFIDPPFSMFLQGVAEVTQDARFRLLLAGATYTDHEVEPVRNVAVDGFVFYAPMMHDPRVAYVGQRELPAVLVDGEPGSGFPLVGIEDESGAFALAEHLFRLGHKKLGIISMPLRPGYPIGFAEPDDAAAAFLAVRDRLAGYAAAARKHGLPWPEVATLYVTSVNSIEQGRQAAHAILSGPNPPTALVCLSDQLALGALAAARELRIAVPHALSIVGYDDIPEAARTTPSLTTVHQPHVEKGRVAAHLLLDQLAGRKSPSRLLPTRLVVRDSSAAPARAGRRAAAGRVTRG
ncbi:MAG TPA: LacI family DNA-binding transcriptional regulator [Kofleriaceae bacterium]|nr:LacI family DNA-binding transcriptional regulator [Kofleriaceae bacterium]